MKKIKESIVVLLNDVQYGAGTTLHGLKCVL